MMFMGLDSVGFVLDNLKNQFPGQEASVVEKQLPVQKEPVVATQLPVLKEPVVVTHLPVQKDTVAAVRSRQPRGAIESSLSAEFIIDSDDE
jgi:hypothetical protein